jgi:hypothetical protein
VKVERLIIRDVDFIPEQLEDGVLYVAEHFRIAAHSCCCGCGMEVATPLGVGQFKLTRDSDGPTLYPSIGNHDYPCRSHYWVQRGKVTDSYAMSREEILRNRQIDRMKKIERRQTPTGCLSLLSFGLFKK